MASADVLNDVTLGAIKESVASAEYADLQRSGIEAHVLTIVQDEVQQFGVHVQKVTFSDLGKVRSIRLITSEYSFQLSTGGLIKTLIEITPNGVMTALLFGLSLYPPDIMAENDDLFWDGELYGGRYYDDGRIGAYLASSSQLDDGPTLIAEALYERYTDYRIAGIGAHILWQIGNIGDVGLVASQAWENYESVPGTATDYQTQIAGIEWELERERWAVAIQAGKYLKDYYGEKPEYLSADVYFWGEYDWYVRGSTSRISGASLNLVEGYRMFEVYGRAFMAYAGVSADDLSVVSPGNNNDSVYAGAYAEVFSTPHAVLYLWVEAATAGSDMLFTIEVDFTFGTGARAPYFTAFGY